MKTARKASWWRMALAALLLGGIAIGLALLISSGPDFVAGALTQLLGRRVVIGKIELRVGRSLEVELTNVRLYAGDETDGRPLLEVPSALGRQSWPHLLAGQLVPLEWTLENPRLKLLPARATKGLQPTLPLLSLTIKNGTLEWQPRQGEPLLVKHIQLGARRSALSTRLDGSLTADLTRGGVGIGQVTLKFRGLTPAAEFQGSLQGLDLAALPIPNLPALQGRAQGRVALEMYEGEFEGFLDLDVNNFKLDLPNLTEPLTPADMRIRTEAVWRDGTLSVYPHAIRLDDLALSGELHVRPGSHGRVRGRLVLDPFRVGRPGGRLQLIRLMGLRHQTWKQVDERAEDGWIDDMELEFDLPLEGLDEAFAFKRKLRPEELSLIAVFRDGVYRPQPGADPLETISGEVHVRGNRLEIHELRMNRSGEPLPQVELRVDGMHRLTHLPPDERQPPEGPGVPIPGLGPAFRALSEGTNGVQPQPRFRLTDFRVGYTAFVLPIRDLNGWLSFPGGRVVVEEAEGVVGGAPAQLSASWDPQANRVNAEILYLDGQASPAPRPNGSWAEGQFETDLVYLGTWPIEGVAGKLRARGAKVELSDIDGQLGQGELKAKGSISFAEQEGAPFGFEIDVRRADASTVRSYMGLPEGTLTGTTFAHGTLGGRLEPGRLFLEQANVNLDARFEDGTLERLPSTIALARLPSLQGVRALFGQPLPYDTITAHFGIQKGVLRTENFSLQGPELRILAAGDMDLLSEDLQADMTVALLLLQTVDRMIERLPILRDLVLGKDRSLVAIYFRLEGPWEEPRARLVTPDAIKAPRDWAAKVIGIGVRKLKNLFSSGESR